MIHHDRPYGEDFRFAESCLLLGRRRKFIVYNIFMAVHSLFIIFFVLLYAYVLVRRIMLQTNFIDSKLSSIGNYRFMAYLSRIKRMRGKGKKANYIIYFRINIDQQIFSLPSVILFERILTIFHIRRKDIFLLCCI